MSTGDKPKPDFSNVQSGSSSTAPPPAAPKPAEPRTYTVVAGDNLSKIAKHFYGDANKWKKIFEANHDSIKNPDLIQRRSGPADSGMRETAMNRTTLRMRGIALCGRADRALGVQARGDAAASDSAAAAAPAPAAPAPAPFRVSGVEVGNAIGADKRVTAPSATLAPADTIYASVATVGAAPSVTLVARWTYARRPARQRGEPDDRADRSRRTPSSTSRSPTAGRPAPTRSRSSRTAAPSRRQTFEVK